MPVMFKFPSGERSVETFEDLKAEGIHVSNIRRKSHLGSGEEILCVNLNEGVNIRHSQESWGDRNYYAFPVLWQEVNTFTGQETPGRGFDAYTLTDEELAALTNGIWSESKGKYENHGFVVSRLILSTFDPIGD